MFKLQPKATRRHFLVGASATLFAGCAKAQARELTVYKSPYCGCCGDWIAHMSAAGFRPKVIETEDLTTIREQHGIPFELSSCHTGIIDDYVIEGHVPAADVVRLLDLKPAALGLTVPGMPLGSPGMEGPSGEKEPFDTLLLIDRTGHTSVFARHA